MPENPGKMRTRITPDTDSFYAVDIILSKDKKCPNDKKCELKFSFKYFIEIISPIWEAPKDIVAGQVWQFLNFWNISILHFSIFLSPSKKLVTFAQQRYVR